MHFHSRRFTDRSTRIGEEVQLIYMVIYTKRKSYGVRVEIWLYVGVNPLGRVDIKKSANFYWDGITVYLDCK